jgi:enamine deaminase RidA (YjgF/YER057c/UK114 family)
MITRVDTSARMSKIVIHNATAYLCGQVGSGDDVGAQTQDCLARIDALLAKAGSSRDRILQAVVWLADIKDYDAMNAVWDHWVPKGSAPARACGEARLAGDDLLVEIIITAAID